MTGCWTFMGTGTSGMTPPRAASMEMVFRRYAERIVGCIENVTNPNCTLSSKERKSRNSQDPKNPARFRGAVPCASEIGLYAADASSGKMETVTLCYAEGAFISAVKRRHVKTFAKLKANR